MKDFTSDIFHVSAGENRTAPVEEHRSSVNGRVVPDNQVRHPQVHGMFSTTGKLVYTYRIHHKDSTESNHLFDYGDNGD